MKAAVFHGARDIRLEEVADPAGELGQHEVLIDVVAAGICGTDLHEYLSGPLLTSADPHPLTGASLPQVLGHEFSGRIREIGSAVTSLRPGDGVAVMPAIYCGTCFYCLRGLQQHCAQMGAIGLSSRWGAFAKSVIAFDYQTVRVPEHMSLIVAALLEPTSVAISAVDDCDVRPGENVLVVGAGPIGALVAMAATCAGAGQVLVSEPNAARRSVVEAADLRGVHVFDPARTPPLDEVMKFTGGIGVDVAFDCAGNAAALDLCIRGTRSRGIVGQTGVHVRPGLVDLPTITSRGLTLKGNWCWPVYSFPRVISLMSSGRLPAETVISSEIGLDQILAEGFDRLVEPGNSAMKVLVRPS